MTRASAPTRAERREAVLGPISDHLLAHGVAASNLRALAASAGTSDRMLLYYFESRNDLMKAALERICERILKAFEVNQPENRMGVEELIDWLWSITGREDFRPTMVLLLDVIVRSGREGEPFASIADNICRKFIDAIADRLAIEDDSERKKQAVRALATIDGFILLSLAKIDLD